MGLLKNVNLVEFNLTNLIFRQRTHTSSGSSGPHNLNTIQAVKSLFRTDAYL